MPVRPSSEPVADKFGLVARRIVHHDMHVEAIRDVTFDLVEELAELLRAVAWHTGADHGACLNPRLRRHGSDETREERRRAMTVVVVRAPLDLSGTLARYRVVRFSGLFLDPWVICRPPQMGATGLVVWRYTSFCQWPHDLPGGADKHPRRSAYRPISNGHNSDEPRWDQQFDR
jgi:hypothetical protein